MAHESQCCTIFLVSLFLIAIRKGCSNGQDVPEIMVVWHGTFEQLK